MWIARDKNNLLYIYLNKPFKEFKEDDVWTVSSKNSDKWFNIPSTLFPNLKWENEPIEVELYDKSEKLALISDVLNYCQRFGSDVDSGTVYEFLFAKTNEK